MTVNIWQGDVHGQYASVGFCLMHVYMLGCLDGAELTEFQVSTDLLLEISPPSAVFNTQVVCLHENSQQQSEFGLHQPDTSSRFLVSGHADQYHL